MKKLNLNYALHALWFIFLAAFWSDSTLLIKHYLDIALELKTPFLFNIIIFLIGVIIFLMPKILLSYHSIDKIELMSQHTLLTIYHSLVRTILASFIVLMALIFCHAYEINSVIKFFPDLILEIETSKVEMHDISYLNINNLYLFVCMFPLVFATLAASMLFFTAIFAINAPWVVGSLFILALISKFTKKYQCIKKFKDRINTPHKPLNLSDKDLEKLIELYGGKEKLLNDVKKVEKLQEKLG